MVELREFWEIVQDVWNEGLFGATVGQILIALGILVLAIIVRRLFARLVISNLRVLTQRTRGQFDDLVLDAIDPPLRLVPVILGIYLAFRSLDMDPDYWDTLVTLVRSLVAFTIFWAIFRAVTPLSQVFERLNGMLGEATVQWIVKALKVIVAFIGGAVILQMWGIEVGPLLAGLGLFGVAVALGAQDLFKNLIAGVLILVEKRFAPGEWVLVDGVVEGTVESIGFRSTFIRRFDKAPVFVPNAKLSDNAVTNFSRMTHRRIYWKIGVEYGATTEQLREICSAIEEYVVGNEEFAGRDEVSTFVHVDAFNASSIDIMLYCFTKTTNWGDWLKIKEELAYRIKEIVEGAGSAFAFPSQSVYLEKVPFDVPETFMPPGEKAQGEGKGREGDPNTDGENATRNAA
ncbi:mechanosensitive ion channel family protein [Iodidimonas sp. SYSU 1G8]|uniref:mechanosensitive ion channel family protein n=1 Tax=Iodidimonas sp. SYSU 1G8 TaxID=3133967 RepID=UPI0031FED008